MQRLVRPFVRGGLAAGLAVGLAATLSPAAVARYVVRVRNGRVVGTHGRLVRVAAAGNDVVTVVVRRL